MFGAFYIYSSSVGLHFAHFLFVFMLGLVLSVVVAKTFN